MEEEKIRAWVEDNRDEVKEFLSVIDPGAFDFLDFRFGLTGGGSHSLAETADNFAIELEEAERRERHLLRAFVSRMSQEKQ